MLVRSALFSLGVAGMAVAQSQTVVISQVYGGGGNSGALYDQDFIELLNKSGSAIDLTGWSVQYASATGAFSSSNTKALSGVIPAGGYFLIGCAFGTDLTPADLPTPDLLFPSTSTLSMGAASGKVALVNTLTPLATLTLPNASVVDLVAYGTSSPAEGSGPAPTLSSVLSAQRKVSGSLDTDNNATDFEALAPAPRNSQSPPFGGDSIAPTLAAEDPLFPANGGSSVLLTTNLSLRLSEVVAVGTGNVLLYLEAGTTDTLVQTFLPADGVVSGDTITYNPTALLNANSTYYVVVEPTAIKDFAANFFAGLSGNQWTFTTGNNDGIPPVATLSPANGSTGFLPTGNLILTYNEPIQLGNAGASVVLRNPDASVRETITLPSPLVTVSGSTLSINPTVDLDPGLTYSVTLTAGVATDLTGNPSAAISTWSFTTRPVPQVLISQYHEGTGTGLNRFIELKNTTASPVSLAGYQLVAWSPSDGGNQLWKATPGTTTRVTNFSNELTTGNASNITIPANGNYLVMLPGSISPLDSSNNADLIVGDDSNPAVTFFSGTASIVLYSAANFNVTSIVDAISIVTTEGTDTTFYRANNLTGFDLIENTSVTDYPDTWIRKTVPEVVAATPADEFYLKGSTVPGALTLTFAPDSISEAAGTAASIATVTRTGSLTSDAFLTLSSSDESELFIPFSVMIPANSASASFEIEAVNDTVPDGSKMVTITASGQGYYTGTGTVTVTDDGDGPINLVINEVDSDTPGTDTAEFIELYNNSDVDQPLAGLVLVLLNGGVDNDPVYATIELTGTIPAKGFYVVGNAAVNPNQGMADGLLQNGPDGIALCMGTAAEFPNGLPAANLGSAVIDAMTYGTGDEEDSALSTALGTTGIADEGTLGTMASARRPADGGAPFVGAFVMQEATPGTTNVITPPADGYATWATTNAGGQGINGDFDNDGVKNGLEYFFGATGSTFTPNPGVVAGKIKWPTAGVTDLDYAVQTSTDLVIWNDVTPDLSETGFISYTLPASTPGTPKLFVRFLIETLEP